MSKVPVKHVGDYILNVYRSNRTLFKNGHDTKITITSGEVVEQIRLAFEAGRKAGIAEVENEKSLFAKIFG